MSSKAMLIKKTFHLAAILICTILICTMLCAPSAAAQDPSASAKPQPEKASEEKAKPRLPIEQYHLEFSINEFEDGKKINSRQYSMNLATNESNEIKIGTRVPVETKENEMQYIDVGTNIFARIGEDRDQAPELTVRSENSSFAMDLNPGEKHDSRPVIRQLKMGGSVLLPVLKPVVIGSADDPSSRRQFQLEVTVTKVR